MQLRSMLHPELVSFTLFLSYPKDLKHKSDETIFRSYNVVFFVTDDYKLQK